MINNADRPITGTDITGVPMSVIKYAGPDGSELTVGLSVNRLLTHVSLTRVILRMGRKYARISGTGPTVMYGVVRVLLIITRATR